MKELVEAARALVAAMETCHQCRALLMVASGPIHCQDGCSPDCGDHEEPDCEDVVVLHARLKQALEIQEKSGGGDNMSEETAVAATNSVANFLERADGELVGTGNFVPDAGLPKWPQMLVVGKPVSADQAREIIRRTDTFFESPDYSGNDRTYNQRVCRKLGIPLGSNGEVWEAQNVWREAWGYVATDYVHNAWISCSFIGGPHGWCHPDGTILFVDNVGKWPSVGDVLGDWRKLSEAFPFVDLVAVLMSAEESEDPEPVVGIRVVSGNAWLFDPSRVSVPRVGRDFEHTLQTGPAVVGVAAEHGIPWSWIEEWSRMVPAPALPKLLEEA